MVSIQSRPEPELLRDGIKVPVKETLLTPRFYTTDYDKVAKMDTSLQQAELEAVVEELRTDYNRNHFKRDKEFEQSWEHIDQETRAAFIDFLERSCTSEFSGFLLFKELSRQLKDRNPLLSEAFNLMARDEARHAGFLNKAMKDFHLSLDLVNMTKKRSYTFFKPEWVIYSVYLSEKIGYWRYILVHYHMQNHPENRFYPLFKYFESWCQDENRHGDFFKVLLRSQPDLWGTWQAKLWARFFLLTVFATHTITVFERADFYKSIGLDARQYNKEVVINTNHTAISAFPTVLDTDHPDFFPRLEKCVDYNFKLTTINESDRPQLIKNLQKLPLLVAIVWQLLLVYLIKPIDAEVQRGTVL
ncbi:magnesium-protoporphyrin IX monomethyl ester (oxidative) cyclase [Pseudanabaena sp. FACHB-1998]|uniref:magnesium-protoporphyrin IX monomethyl ester (oxidative) cyclase n=1 Tax=Pseudanabaena sp. FACHB-1998 TaxID=2692858 RepID=UPI0016802837|nr:magnesium-protoporphyrin IX monomethyl ester (oxidative) cyclase [Pseudanabaena sp. FACHB-1998]MBD2176023.1 magnesium-protoporphyrin IX monomethyl ester (oxidative) cyclase [Pseudanabaena sp. FACHB-1998]